MCLLGLDLEGYKLYLPIPFIGLAGKMHEETFRKPWKMHGNRLAGTSENGQHWCGLYVPGSPPKQVARCRECLEADLGGLRRKKMPGTGKAQRGFPRRNTAGQGR